MNFYEMMKIEAKIMIKKTIILILPLMLLLGCRDEFMPDVDGYENLLVVDGMITTEYGPYTIKLSRTSEVNKPDYKPLSGCEVRIEENAGEIEVLTEEEPGVYKTSRDGIQGKVGKSYRLSIITPEGKEYASEFIEMKPEVEIDSIRAELQFKESQDYPRPLGGYQFYVTTKPAEEDANILWKMKETYEYTSQFKINYIYRGMGIEEFQNSDTLYRCWKTQTIDQFFTSSTRPLTGTQITNQPLHFVNSSTKRLQVRYSLLVKQYNLNNEAYQYWNELREQIASDDFLFASQPYQILGNVSNVDDAEEAVLGYFTVGSVTTKRAFFNKPDIEFFYNKCVPNPDLRGLGFMGPDQFPVYLANSSVGIALASEFCFDCTLWDGKLNKPDFWVDGKFDNNQP